MHDVRSRRSLCVAYHRIAAYGQQSDTISAPAPAGRAARSARGAGTRPARRLLRNGAPIFAGVPVVRVEPGIFDGVAVPDEEAVAGEPARAADLCRCRVFCRSPHPKPLSLSGRGASDSIRERNLRRLPLLPVREKGAGGMRGREPITCARYNHQRRCEGEGGWGDEGTSALGRDPGKTLHLRGRPIGAPKRCWAGTIVAGRARLAAGGGQGDAGRAG
jgi:hypothetical protein